MHESLEVAEGLLGVELPHLRGAAAETVRRCAEIEQGLKIELGEGANPANGLDIVAFGSIAREEMSNLSDFDYLVIAHQTAAPELLRSFRKAVVDVHHQMEIPPPGESGLFGKVIAPQELVDRIGLESDTNLSHSRRVLVLEESRSLLQPERHQALVSSILSRYLHDYRDDAPRVPRFLVNDLLRYWRTVAVDYQAKRWEELEAKKWGLRYLKLRSTRKLTFAGSLVAVLLPAITGEMTTAARLEGEFAKPALARLASLAPHLPDGEDRESLARILVLADRFIGWLADDGWRSVMGAVVDPGDPANAPAFIEARDATVDLHRALDDLFHSAVPVLGSHAHITTFRDLTRHYLMF